MRRIMKSGSYPVMVALMMPLAATSTEAAAKTHPGGTAPVLQTPFPLRRVVLKPVGTRAFQLPNGTTTNLSYDLKAVLNTAVNATQVFAPFEPIAPRLGSLCESHLEIEAVVSTMDLDVVEAGIKIGYTSNGQLGPVTGISGSAKVKVGTIAMDFKVSDCDAAGSCTRIASSTATQATAGVDLAFNVDFGMISIGPDLIYNTPLGGILRKIMDKGLLDLSKDRYVNTLSWQAKVREYIPSAGVLIFDAGAQSRILPNQVFTVLAPVDMSAGVNCNSFHPVAHVHTSQIEFSSSSAVVDEILDNGRGIHEGDVVQIRPLELNLKP